MFVLRNVNIDNLDILLRLLLERSRILNLMHDIHSLESATEDGVLAIKPWLKMVSVKLPLL